MHDSRCGAPAWAKGTVQPNLMYESEVCVCNICSERLYKIQFLSKKSRQSEKYGYESEMWYSKGNGRKIKDGFQSGRVVRKEWVLKE